MAQFKATAVATPNIALVKYWGKRDEKLILPCEGSISITLDEALKSTTTVEFSGKFAKDEVSIDGAKVEGEQRGRVVGHLNLMRRDAGAKFAKMRAKVVSKNNFPAAAGMASSASGFAALTLACAKALGMGKSAEELSIYARQGSGSACRSLMGGFVEWKRGGRSDGKDSYAVQVAPASHWPDIVDVIAIVQKERKKVSSRAGMRQTVETSALFKERLKMLPARLERARKAIWDKDFEALMAETMADSDNMHACMADTKPAIVYMNEVSHAVARAVRMFNADAGRTVAGYTFDAGPNAHLITTRKDLPAVRKMLAKMAGVREIIVSGIGKGPKAR